MAKKIKIYQGVRGEQLISSASHQSNGQRASRARGEGGTLTVLAGIVRGGVAVESISPFGAVSYRAIKSELKYQFIAGDFIWALGALGRGKAKKKHNKNNLYMYCIFAYI